VDNATDGLVELTHRPSSSLPVPALAIARLSLLDWLACGLGGRTEPLSKKMRALAEAEGGAQMASLFGGGKAPARMAALVNAATSHALDYDDTHFAHVGHLSVGVYPAALAIGEKIDADIDDIVAAFLVGAEAAIRIGKVLGQQHYDLGFHQTATAGAFGATLAAARLLNLSAPKTRHALGLCATRASGVKSQFGTMGKPYNAGIAASNGVECAVLADLGMTSADDGLFGEQGFVATHTPEPHAFDTTEHFLFADNKFKLHACCHGTHAMIEGLLALCVPGGLANVERVTLHTNPRWFQVCDQKQPRTGLEVKFSYVWLAGMALRGDSTADDATYCDALASDEQLAGFARKVDVLGDPALSDMEAQGDLQLANGEVIPFSYDLSAPMPHDLLKRKLRTKAEALLGQKANDVWRFSEPGDQKARDIGDVIRARDKVK
jgi:2-methylcitrate dehydratase PrpD